MAASEQLKKLVGQLPDPARNGMLIDNIDGAKIEKIIAEIYKGGRENFLGLVDLLGEPGSEENVKPHYALHCLGNHTLVVKDEKGRKTFCEVLAGELGADRPAHIKAYLCQELGSFGGGESLKALGQLLTDAQLSGPASMALVSIGDGASAQRRAAWPIAENRARLHIIDGLAALADPGSVDIFKPALADSDQEVRIAAAAGLAELGDAGSAEAMLKTASKAKDWERFQAAKSCLVLGEKLLAAGKKAEAKSVYEKLKASAKGASDAHIRDAADRGLAKV